MAKALGKVRTGTVKRDTTETQIALKLVIDGQGVYKVSTGIRFFDPCWSCLRGMAAST